VSTHPWGVRSMTICSGRKFDMTKEQIDRFVSAGRLRTGHMHKGKMFTLLPEDVKPEN
jgi:hypothetical protein